MNELISIITPAYNAERYIGAAIDSVLAQDHKHWELLIVNDGSSDGTSGVVRRYDDPRIILIEQSNTGIGGARNAALERIKGQFICFLDADDVLPSDSLSARLYVFRSRPATDVVDGAVETRDEGLSTTMDQYRPNFNGDPFPLLLTLDRRCFFGNTWMIRAERVRGHRFERSISHGEDLLFYLMCGKGMLYDHTERTVLIYRRTRDSTMTDLSGLERSYRWIGRWMGDQEPGIALHTRIRYGLKWRRVMAAAYWRTSSSRSLGRSFRQLIGLIR